MLMHGTLQLNKHLSSEFSCLRTTIDSDTAIDVTSHLKVQMMFLSINLPVKGVCVRERHLVSQMKHGGYVVNQ